MFRILLFNMDLSNKQGTKAAIPRVNITTHGVETPIPLSGSGLVGVLDASYNILTSVLVRIQRIGDQDFEPPG